jgi:3-hydroxyisobutyrate dehydrogenase-like beta-hydroxyacid dehydrogenase
MTGVTIAFLGLGHMGLPMARNLIAAGFNLRVWNRTPEKARELTGATVAETPRAAAVGADFVVTMLADDAAVESVAFGTNGIIAGMKAGALHIGMSTISVDLGRRLAEAHPKAESRYISAPVFGRPDAAAARQLWIVPGGAAADRDSAQPIFAALGQGTFPMDTAPQANLAKLIGNFLIAATVETLGEAFVLGEKGGIEPTRLLDMLAGTLFGSPVVKGYGARIARTEFVPAGFALPLGLKDIELARAAAAEFGARLPVADLVEDRMLAAIARGRANFDWAGFATVIREDAGLKPVRDGAN